MVKVYQLSDLTNGDVPHNVNHPYTAVSGYIPGDKVGRHVGQYIWCKARAEIAGAPWFAPEELAIIRQIYSEDIQIVYCLDGVTGTKTMVASWGRLSDDEEWTVETRDFQLFTNAVVERSGEFWKYIPGPISRDHALFCVGKASDEAYHAQLREHFQKPENLGIEPEKVGVAPNEDEAERKDFEEELQQTGRRRGDVIWAKDIEPVTELRVVSADTQSVYPSWDRGRSGVFNNSNLIKMNVIRALRDAARDVLREVNDVFISKDFVKRRKTGLRRGFREKARVARQKTIRAKPSRKVAPIRVTKSERKTLRIIEAPQPPEEFEDKDTDDWNRVLSGADERLKEINKEVAEPVKEKRERLFPTETLTKGRRQLLFMNVGTDKGLQAKYALQVAVVGGKLHK